MDLDRIVVGFDGSANAIKALDTALSMATPDTVVHVVTAYEAPQPDEMANIMAAMPGEFRTGIDLLEGPRARLRDAEGRCERHGVDHKGHFVEDKPAAAILDTADDVDADLIVVGSRGLGRASRFLRGSVSSRVAAHADHSFLVVRAD